MPSTYALRRTRPTRQILKRHDARVPVQVFGHGVVPADPHRRSFRDCRRVIGFEVIDRDLRRRAIGEVTLALRLGVAAKVRTSASDRTIAVPYSIISGLA